VADVVKEAIKPASDDDKPHPPEKGAPD
jgi:hypothetical protein